MYRFKIILLFLCYFSTLNCIGQKTRNIKANGFEFNFSAVDPAINDAFCQVAEMPEFPGGMINLVAFAKRKIRYPKSAINDDIEGNVILKFIINKKGKLINKQVVKSVRADLDNVCIHMLNKMPAWKPGLMGSKKTETYLTWSIRFILTN